MDAKTIGNISSIIIVLAAAIHLGSLLTKSPVNAPLNLGEISVNMIEQIKSIESNSTQQTELMKSILAAELAQTAVTQQQTAAIAENTAAVKSLVELWTAVDPVPTPVDPTPAPTPTPTDPPVQ